MKNITYRFLIFCSGSDSDILEKCSRSEHIKHAGFGGLVLVPAILAFSSMTYAISTFVKNPYIYILAGLTWSSIVFIFDRFVVSTFRKKNSTLRDVNSFPFYSRLIFSFFVGIIVAHPMVLLYFHDSINVNMNDVANSKIDSIETVYKVQKDGFQNRIDTIDRNLLIVTSEIKSWEKAVHDEVISSVRDDARGISGIPGHGPTYRDDTATINRLRYNLHELVQSNSKKKSEDSIQILKIDSIRNSKINRQTFSRDYLEREKALTRLSAANPIINTTVWLLIIFFILVDILPVTWKASTKKGPYDDMLNLVEQEVSNDTQTKIIDSDTKFAIYRRNKERDRIVHNDNKSAEENANRQFSEGERKEILSRVFLAKQSFEADAEIYNESLEKNSELRNKILKTEIEFKQFCFKMIAEIESSQDEEFKNMAYKHLQEIKINFNNTIEFIFRGKQKDSFYE